MTGKMLCKVVDIPMFKITQAAGVVSKFLKTGNGNISTYMRQIQISGESIVPVGQEHIHHDLVDLIFTSASGGRAHLIPPRTRLLREIKKFERQKIVHENDGSSILDIFLVRQILRPWEFKVINIVEMFLSL